MFTAVNGGKTTTEKSPRRRRGATHLSLVVLLVEEVCVARQVYHCLDVVFGLVDDGQVEQPADTESLRSALTYKASATFSTPNQAHGTVS